MTWPRPSRLGSKSDPTVDLALEEPAEPAFVLRAQLGLRPVLAGDGSATRRTTAATRHRVVAVVRRRPVVGELLAGGDVAHGHQHDLALDRDVGLAGVVRVEHAAQALLPRPRRDHEVVRDLDLRGPQLPLEGRPLFPGEDAPALDGHDLS